MKKLFFGFVLFVLTASLAFASFSDVSQNHENYDAVSYVQSAGIVEGYSDGTYRPDNTINRAEFTKIIIEARFEDSTIDSCLAEHGDEPVLPDVDRAEWYAPYICVAYGEGIVSGYPDGTYGPANEISIVEAAKIIVNGFDYQVGGDDIWYKPYMEELGNRAALPTTVTAFDQVITRGEMAEMIYRLLEGISSKDSTSYAELAGEEAEVQAFTIVGDEYDLSPSTFTVSAGATVRITFENAGKNNHNFGFDDLDIATSNIGSGESEVLEFTAPVAGSYTYSCSIPGHQESGMQGTMQVE